MKFIKRYAEFVGCVKYNGEFLNEWICPNKKCGMGVAEEYVCCPYCGQKIKFKEPPKVKMITIYRNGAGELHRVEE